MADYRCPMCGRVNPGDLDICQYCGARLTPLVISNSLNVSDNNVEKKNDQIEGNLPVGMGDPGTTDKRTANNDSDLQDREKKFSSDSEYHEELSLPEETDDVTEGEESFPDNEDWLQRIRSLHEANQETESREGNNQDEAGDPNRFDLADDGIVEDDETEDWQDILHRLAGLVEIKKVGEDVESEERMPDWLINGIDQEKEEITGGLETTSKPESSPKQKEKTEEESVEEWLAQLRMDGESGESTYQDERISDIFSEESNTDHELPDWLLDGEQGQGYEESKIDKEIDSIEITSGAEKELPDWLSNLSVGHTLKTEGESNNGPDLFSDTDKEDQESPLSSNPDDNEVPEWLTNLDEFTSSAEDRETQGIEDSIHEDIGNLHDWLSELVAQETPMGEQVPGVVSETEEDIPEWLKNLDVVGSDEIGDHITAGEPSRTVFPFIGAEIEEDDLLDGEDFPSRLTSEEEDEGRDVPEDSDLALAEIPGWLAAIRPVDKEESGRFQEGNDVENAGPLAGLRGVLPAEPEITQFKKPPVYSAKLRITETQQAHIDTIRRMLAAEGKSEPIPEPSVISTQRMLRWLIGFLLILGISILILGGGQIFPLPNASGIPADILDISRIVSNIPVHKPILVAFDYEPGTSGEMNAAAAALIDHLILRGARLALISTKPTGPAMGEFFIHNIQKEHDYVSGEEYINLGFIPGEAAGLLSFAQTPKWVIQQSFDGVNPWESTILRDIEVLSDFAVFVVITDNFETARTWIEQIQPRIGDTPLLMVVSAKIEPMVRPYSDFGPNRQVAGIVSGITGGAAYEFVIGKTNLSHDYWGAFNIGLIIILAVIILGGTINLILYFISHNKFKDQEVVG